MTTNADFALSLTTKETLAAGVPAISRPPTVVQDAWNTVGALNSGTVPPITKSATFQKALVAGVGTIDLTALPGINGATVDGTGLKVQAILFQNPSTNTSKIVVKAGAANAYNLWGAAFTLMLNPGEQILWKGIDHANVPDVAAGAKNIDINDASVGGTQSLNVSLVLG